MARHKRGYAFIAVIAARRQTYFGGDEALGFFGEQLGAHDVIERCGNDELQPFRQRNELAMQQYKRLAPGIVRADELVFEAELAAEVKGPGFFGEKRIGAGFNDATADLFAADDAAQTRALLKELPCKRGSTAAGLFEVVGRAQAGDAAADDADSLHESSCQLPVAGCRLDNFS